MKERVSKLTYPCLLYTSDAADDMQCVDLVVLQNLVTLFINIIYDIKQQIPLN